MSEAQADIQRKQQELKEIDEWIEKAHKRKRETNDVCTGEETPAQQLRRLERALVDINMEEAQVISHL